MLGMVTIITDRKTKKIFFADNSNEVWDAIYRITDDEELAEKIAWLFDFGKLKENTCPDDRFEIRFEPEVEDWSFNAIYEKRWLCR